MKINIKTIKDEKFEVDAPDNATIGELKTLIEQKFQHQKDWQILIFNGSILADDRSLESVKLSDKDFLVLMIKKPREVKKPAAAPAAAPAAEKKPEAAATPANSASPVASKPVETPAATPGTAVASPAPAPAGASAQGADFLGEASMMVSAEEANQMVSNLCEMGFPRDQVILALRASFFNPHRAVEYLFSGNIPAVAPTPARPAQPQAARPASTTPATPAPAAAPSSAPGAPARPAAAQGANPFHFLRQHPQFEQLRQIARQDPGQLENLLTVMADSNPDMIPIIADNQEAFIRLLTSDEGAPAAGGVGGGGSTGGSGGSSGGGGGVGGDPLITPGPRPGTVQVQVTQADMDSINNLVAMGFDRNRALEAYIVFGRNVDAAANYLLSNPDDDPMDFQGGGGDFGGFGGDDGGDDDDDEAGGDEEGPTDF